MIALNQVCKSYRSGEFSLPVLKNICLTVSKGEFVAIMGQSGSGKTTLMNIIGCLDKVDSGQYHLDGSATGGLSRQALAGLRARNIGFVFQNFNLIPRMSARRNVELPLLYSGLKRTQRATLTDEQLQAVGLSDRAEHLPTQLSGGQQQRVAIARALVNQPDIIVADEPTGSLDSQTGEDIMRLFVKLHDLGKTIIMVTHEHSIARYASRAIMLKDGEIENDVVQL